MQVGTILLTKSNKYVDTEGNLPKRPKFDKELLSSLLAIAGEVSDEGYDMLPPSMQRKVVVGERELTFPITIRELAAANLLIVVRSPEDFENGKEFRLNEFKCLVKDRRIELWIRKI